LVCRLKYKMNYCISKLIIFGYIKKKHKNVILKSAVLMIYQKKKNEWVKCETDPHLFNDMG